MEKIIYHYYFNVYNDKNNRQLRVRKEKYITTSIVKLKSELKPMFYQTHKSCLVNLDNVREIDYSTSTIYFKNGDTTNLIAPSARKGLKQIVGEF